MKPHKIICGEKVFSVERVIALPSEKRQKKSRRNSDKIEKAFDMPQILKPSVPHIETEGNREVIIDGCKGIMEYDDGLIKLNAGSLVVTFRGADLNIRTYSESQSMITGNIIAIEFAT